MNKIVSGDIYAIGTFGENRGMHIMRTAILVGICLLLGAPASFAEVEPEDTGGEAPPTADGLRGALTQPLFWM